MPDAVCRMLTLLCTLVVACPIGTNLGLLHLLWMLASGRLLGARGALFPALADCGLSAPRRAWVALGQGDWTSGQLIGRLLGPTAAAHPWPAPAVPGAHALSAGLPLARTPPRKSVRDGPSPRGILGAAAYPCHARHTHDPCRSNLSYRKPEN